MEGFGFYCNIKVYLECIYCVIIYLCVILYNVEFMEICVVGEKNIDSYFLKVEYFFCLVVNVDDEMIW